MCSPRSNSTDSVHRFCATERQATSPFFDTQTRYGRDSKLCKPRLRLNYPCKASQSDPSTHLPPSIRPCLLACFLPSLRGRERNEPSIRDPGATADSGSAAEGGQESVEEWMGKEDMLLNRGRPFPLPRGEGPSAKIILSDRDCPFQQSCTVRA